MLIRRHTIWIVWIVLLLVLGCTGCAYFNPGPAGGPQGGSGKAWENAPDTSPGAWQNRG